MAPPRSASAVSSVAIGSMRSDTGGPPVFAGDHLGAEAPEGARQPRLHGSSWDPERLRRLGLRQVEEVSRPDDLAILVAERVDRADERRSLLVGEDRRLGRWSRIVRGAVLGGTKRES